MRRTIAIPVTALKKPGTALLAVFPALTVLAVLSSSSGPPCQVAASAPLGVGNHVPPLEVTDLEGRIRRFDWPGLDDGATLLFFFDITTPQGLYGMTVLDRLYQAAHDFGLDVLAIESGSLDREGVSRALERYLSLYPAPLYPVAHDPGGGPRRILGVETLPSAYLVQQHGVILDRRENPGEKEWDALAARIGKILHVPAGILGESAPDGGDRDEEADGGRTLFFPGDRAPDFEVVDIGGAVRSFSWPSPEEKALILFAWEDPCPSCIREMLFLDRLYVRAKDVGLPLEVLSVAGGGLSPAGVASVLDRLRRVYPAPSFPFVADGDGRIEGLFGWGDLPATFFFDSEGILVRKEYGFTEERAAEWLNFLESTIPGAEGVLLHSLAP